MLTRILAVTLNTYREAVRARLLLGVFVVALTTCAGSVLVAALSLHNEPRVVADLGAASFSFYGVVVAIVLGSTSLYRELEHKTVFPILSRPIRRWEYLLGKYFGTLLTVAVFVAVDVAVVLAALALLAGEPAWKEGALFGGMLVLLGAWIAGRRDSRTFVGPPWALALAIVVWWTAEIAGDERRLVVASAALALCEVGVVTALATLFASFSSPFLTATFTAMIFVIGRRSDSLGHLPPKLFGAFWTSVGRGLAHVVPNLQAFVPARPLLLGQVPAQPVWSYVGVAALHAASYATALLVVSALTFRKRDFA